MKKLYYLLTLCVCIPSAMQAQSKTDFYRLSHQQRSGFGFRMGLNYSLATVSDFYVNSSTPITSLGGVRPKSSYYLGGFYYKELIPNQLTYRLEANLQQKGVGSVDPVGKPVINARYYYLGVTPLIGLQLFNKLTIYTGPELNVLVAKTNSWGKGYPLEIGLTARLSYTVGKIGIEASYFRGFTRYDQLKDSSPFGGPFEFDFYNQNAQLGLIYHWQ
ncbi:hypothetical protein GO755_26070 [Spirosoma sp. HMF4905]|uniref:Outer membrane protein beta-barrel domain-containing protein n=1 Tax=Spirosoma arboris TaxID=2682092 RepID=A0A7K1SI81_9BACT|nr:hypothetical protein [Spirosoma arboris]MVM33531.1 hypothetical protein [Spirosoma arboris]